jgi:hypothetical protein
MLVRCKKQQPPLHNYTCPQLFAWFMIDPEDYFCFCAHFHCHPFAYPVRFQLRHGTCQCHHSGTSKSPLKRSFVEQRFRSPRPHGYVTTSLLHFPLTTYSATGFTAHSHDTIQRAHRPTRYRRRRFALRPPIIFSPHPATIHTTTPSLSPSQRRLIKP